MANVPQPFDPSLSDITTPARGLVDMLAAALRGGVKGTLGLPGDIESLFRDKTVLPTTEDWDKRLPALNPGSNFQHPYEKLGEFMGLPGAGIAAKSTIGALRKGASKAIDSTIDPSKRASLSSLGKGALAVGATAAMPTGMVLEALKSAPTVARVSASSAMLAPILAKVYAKVSDAKYFNPVTPEQAIKHTQEVLPELSNDAASTLLKRFSAMYDVTPKTHTGKFSSQADVDKLLAKSDDEILDAVANGTLNPYDYPPGLFDTVNTGDHPKYSDVLQIFFGRPK